MVGKSTVTIQTGKSLTKTDKYILAEEIVPGLSKYGLPDRSPAAEKRSFFLQASKRRLIESPSQLVRDEVLDLLLPRYPTFHLPYENFYSKQFDDELEHCISLLKADASPGIPYILRSRDNAGLIEKYKDEVKTFVKDRITLRLNTAHYRHLTPVQLVEAGLVDPVRLFIKDELHKTSKLKEGRLRLIMSVSVVDKLIEMVLIRRIKETEVNNWHSIPSVPGLGFTDEMSVYFFDQVHGMERPVSSDVSGWDWSCQQWLHDDAGEFTIRQCLNATEEWKHLIRMDAYLAGHSLYSTSDGDLLVLDVPGNINSGRFQTSRGNSLCRNIVRMHVSDDFSRPNQSRSMGDDCIEDYVSDAVNKYKQLGIDIKVYDEIENEFEFCSRIFTKFGSYPANPEKLLGNILMTQPKTMEELLTWISAFESEMKNHPEIETYVKVLSRVGYLKLGGEQNIDLEKLYYYA